MSKGTAGASRAPTCFAHTTSLSCTPVDQQAPRPPCPPPPPPAPPYWFRSKRSLGSPRASLQSRLTAQFLQFFAISFVSPLHLTLVACSCKKEHHLLQCMAYLLSCMRIGAYIQSASKTSGLGLGSPTLNVLTVTYRNMPARTIS